MLKWMLGLIVVAGGAGVSSGQTIYAPVTYQHGARCVYYYGGDSPWIVERAERDCHAALMALRARGVTLAKARVYSDLFPFVDAALWGFTINDARNAAYARVPRYFVKRGLTAPAAVVPSGPAPLVESTPVKEPVGPRHEGTISIEPYRKAPGRAVSRERAGVSRPFRDADERIQLTLHASQTAQSQDSSGHCDLH